MDILLSHYLEVLYILVEDLGLIIPYSMMWLKLWFLIGLLNIKISNGNFLVISSALDITIVQSKLEHWFILSEVLMMIPSKYFELLFHLKGFQHGWFRSMEIWNVEDLTRLNYQATLTEYPDLPDGFSGGTFIRINADQCT